MRIFIVNSVNLVNEVVELNNEIKVNIGFVEVDLQGLDRWLKFVHK
jgi:hypothetical protein